MSETSKLIAGVIDRITEPDVRPLYDNIDSYRLQSPRHFWSLIFGCFPLSETLWLDGTVRFEFPMSWRACEIAVVCSNLVYLSDEPVTLNWLALTADRRNRHILHDLPFLVCDVATDLQLCQCCVCGQHDDGKGGA
jgi:hypothetical protein